MKYYFFLGLLPIVLVAYSCNNQKRLLEEKESYLLSNKWILNKESNDTLYFDTKPVLYDRKLQYMLEFSRDKKVIYTRSEIVDFEENFGISKGTWRHDHRFEKLETTLVVELELKSLEVIKIDSANMIVKRLDN
ncbi:MAG: hypothetical protein AAFP19_19405 [Bacteroidota bacterium]